MKLSRLTEITSNSVTSEASGYELDNCVGDEIENDLSFWRSTDLSAQTVTLNFSGTINFLAIFGANFDTITIGGTTYTLEYDHAWGSYRGYFDLGDTATPLSFIVPVQSVTGSYFTFFGVCIGQAFELSNAVWGLKRSLADPQMSGKTSAGQTRSASTGHPYYIISISRNKNSHAGLMALNEFKQQVGKTEVFILFEDLGYAGRCYLCRRTDNFSWEQAALNDHRDNLVVREV